MSAPKGINWDEVPLGQEPDAVIARRLGVTRAVVGRARRRRGIAALVKPRAEVCNQCGGPVPESSRYTKFCSQRCCNANYGRSDQGRAAHRRYKASAKGRAAVRAAQLRYLGTDSGRTNQRALHRRYYATRAYGPDLAPVVVARLEAEDWIRENVDPAVVAEFKAALRGGKE